MFDLVEKILTKEGEFKAKFRTGEPEKITFDQLFKLLHNISEVICSF